MPFRQPLCLAGPAGLPFGSLRVLGLVFVGTTGFDLFFFPIVAFAFGVLRFDFVLITARFRFVLAAANFALAPTVARSGLEKYPFIGLK